MSENRFWFVIDKGKLEYVQDNVTNEKITVSELEDLLNEQQELIEELQVSDEMGWKRAEHFEKKCPKELHNKKMYIKRLEYKVQKFKEENEQLRKYNEQLKERLEKINGGYGHLTHRNGLTANEWLIESQERELKNKNEQISDWIERHSKDIEKISEQQNTISQLEEENEQLKSDIMLIEKNADRHYEENKQLKKELNEYRQVIIDKVQYYEDNLEDFLIKKGVIKEDWARFDDYD